MTRQKNNDNNYWEQLRLEKQLKERENIMKFFGFGSVIFTLIFATSLFFVFLQKVPTGNVGIKVYLLGSNKGVDSEELTPGRYWIGWNQELYIFPTFTQNYVWTAGNDEGSENDESISFQTSEGMTVNADVGISYHIKPNKVNDIFQKYRRGINEITDTYLRNMVRDALVTEASVKPVEVVYGAGKANLMDAVEKRVKEQVSKYGIEIERIYWIGTVRLPDKVIEALNAKIEATQKAAQRQNEIATAKAEADQKIEEARGEAESIFLKKKAEADGNKLVNDTLTPELIKYEYARRWNGALPRMTGTGAVPFINIPLDDPIKKAPNVQ